MFEHCSGSFLVGGSLIGKEGALSWFSASAFHLPPSLILKILWELRENDRILKSHMLLRRVKSSLLGVSF